MDHIGKLGEGDYSYGQTWRGDSSYDRYSHAGKLQRGNSRYTDNMKFIIDIDYLHRVIPYIIESI